MSECIFPGCLEPTDRRDDGTFACATHQNVHVSGSYVNDRHRDGGHG